LQVEISKGLVTMHKIELLSPARDLETGMAAINFGADAVYLGAARFGAREAAGNSMKDIEQLALYAHKYWAKVYVTVNTLLYDEELAEAEMLILQIYQAGADALIIQDVGLLELDLPPLPLFASTQMHNHTPERVAFLEQVGFQRVILARELSLEQIREIRAATQIELETFIHGALCVCYSGQCYMSYALGKRSGNRGQCAQPCRRAYSLVDGDGRTIVPQRYLLSLRDLNLNEAIPDLIDAGICSFKVEGRLKDIYYVKNVVAHYRQLIDIALNERGRQASASGIVHHDFTPDPYKTFNRSYSSYFLHSRGAAIASNDTPKSTGEPLGKVVSVSSHSFVLEPSAPEIHPGDGLCFMAQDNELSGTIINRVEGRSIFPESMIELYPGLQIYRNHDHSFTNQLDKSQSERKIRIQFRLNKSSAGLCLTAMDEDGNQASFSLKMALAPAKQIENATMTIERQLSKLGDTELECNRVDLILDPIPFLPVSRINAMRRGVVEKLAVERQHNRPILQGGAIKNNVPYPTKKLTFEGNVLNQRAVDFYHRHGVEEIEPAAESGLELRGRKVMTTRYCLRYQLNACPQQTEPQQKLSEPLSLVDEQGNQFQLRFNCVDCVMEIYYQNNAIETR
jgi:putative protease